MGESVRPVFGEPTQTGNFEDYDIDEDLYTPEVLSIDGLLNNKLEVGESIQLFATSIGNVSWEIVSGEGVVEIEYIDYPKNKSVRINALSAGTAEIEVIDEFIGGGTSIIFNIYVYPSPTVINTPSMDETTLLFQIENATCDDFELYLMGIDGVWEDAPENKFERVEGTTSWFQVTVPAMDESQSNFKIRANGDWTYEPKQGYEFLDDAAEYVAAGADGGNPDNLMMLQAAGGKVIALKVIEFNSPCDE